MKTCTKCRQQKLLEDFAWKQKNKNIKHSMCNPCRREYSNALYKNNEATRKKTIERSKRVTSNHRIRFNEYKKTLNCFVCKETEPSCLDFHHIDPSKKDFTISEHISKSGWNKLMEEISKCIVLCANCHRKVHANVIDLNALVSSSATNGD